MDNVKTDKIVKCIVIGIFAFLGALIIFSAIVNGANI